MIALKMLVRGVMRSSAHSFRTILGILSGPGALYSDSFAIWFCNWFCVISGGSGKGAG